MELSCGSSSSIWLDETDIAENLSMSLPNADVPPITCSTPMYVPMPETATTSDEINKPVSVAAAVDMP